MMKKIFIVLIAIVLALTACGDGTKPDNNNGVSAKTTLTVSNLPFLGLVFSYGSADFVLGWGAEVTKEVSTGSGYGYITGLYISYQSGDSGGITTLNNYTFKTELITCEEGKNTVFNITNNTVVTLLGGYDGSGDITGTIKYVSDNLVDYLILNSLL
jgi:hypothetical protein